ncbi:MAG TPA: FeoA family protein [Anaerolineales bacterium]|nr:FeoA family protein [Anaerolineales bacterium]
MTHTKQISLAELPVDGQAIIVQFSSGRSETNRLVSLGFTPGAKIGMAQNYGRGPLIVTVRGARVALGRGEANKIIVEQRQPNE